MGQSRRHHRLARSRAGVDPLALIRLVVVHGLGDRALSWRRFADSLPATIEAVTFDLPGHGEAGPADDYRYSALVAAVDRAAGKGIFALLGHSVGGAVAWLYAARHPERVSHLVLVEAAAPHQSAFIHGPTPKPEHPYTHASPEEARQVISGIFPRFPEEDIRSDYRQRPDGRWEPNFDPAYFPALVDDARDHGEEYLGELRAIACPTLVVRASESFMSREQLDEISAPIEGAVRATIEGAGHMVHRERPEALARLVGDFLRSGGG